MSLDPVTLSVLSSALSGIAEEMGALLVRGSYSSNIKERRDCSAALFDAGGRLVAQAEHIPVHLGAMPEAVAAVMGKDLGPGDVYVVNDPYTGGTHLPDITLVSPACVDDEIVAFTVTRAHHSDVGGMRPGSMPGDSTEIYQEGLAIPPVKLVTGGQPVEDVLELILANVRTPRVRRGDLRAQVAANRLGETRLRELADKRGSEVVLEGFNEVLDHAERQSRAAISAMPDGRYAALGALEGDGVVTDDIPIAVEITITGDSMTIDFSGTSGARDGNVNCPLAVTRSACYFAVRVALPSEVPANGGAHVPIDIVVEEGSLLDARRPSAVVAGNVETSQRIADTVLLALSAAVEVPALGQGTMNNVILGGRDWTYYETIGGGQGAGRHGPGASGVHVGMSNTLNTPIEALELEYPLRVEAQELAYDTGGVGRYRGGDGITRSLRMLEDCWLSLITDRRRHGPEGLQGGEPGRVGANLLNGQALASKTSIEIAAGDLLTIRTPGGGGWGRSATGG